MPNYKRQLRNDEKRFRFSAISTVTADDLGPDMVDGDAIALPIIPKETFSYRVTAVVKEAFAPGSTVTYGVGGIYGFPTLNTEFFTDLDLTAVGATISDVLVDMAKFRKEAKAQGAFFNQAAIDSAVGEVQFVFEFVEDLARDGSYTN